ncbi:hypothetical protein Y032_0184g990 [Ancylostoma ceylanicum]|uniref:Uncharacterized protein n=1 Tax=Ancylostoma ceylanicum TaxID=53326 RepID=A0A016SRD7_9BILA|nr:hypothetical protein Y032_0184g990 [Ancylostoma ceylanicum]
MKHTVNPKWSQTRAGWRRGYSGCLRHRSNGPAGQRHGGKPMGREVRQPTRVLASRSYPLSHDRLELTVCKLVLKCWISFHFL